MTSLKWVVLTAAAVLATSACNIENVAPTTTTAPRPPPTTAAPPVSIPEETVQRVADTMPRPPAAVEPFTSAWEFQMLMSLPQAGRLREVTFQDHWLVAHMVCGLLREGISMRRVWNIFEPFPPEEIHYLFAAATQTFCPAYQTSLHSLVSEMTLWSLTDGLGAFAEGFAEGLAEGLTR